MLKGYSGAGALNALTIAQKSQSGRFSTAALWGDSLQANQMVISANVSYLYDSGYASHATAMAGVDVTWSLFATGGLTTAAWIAAWQAQALADSSEVAFIWLGTNNILTSVAFATTIANLTTIYNNAIAAGKYVVAVSIPPINSSASAAGQVVTLNNWIRNFWAGKLGGEYLDVYATLVDAAGSNSPYKTGYNYTGDAPPNVHPGNLGGYYIGVASTALFQRLFVPFMLPESNNDYIVTNSSSNQLFSNPMLLGSGGSSTGGGGLVSGTIASGITVLNTAALTTIVCSTATANSGIGKKQILNITVADGPSAASPVEVLIFTEDMAALTLATHKLSGAARIKTSQGGSVSAAQRIVNQVYSSPKFTTWNESTYAASSLSKYPSNLEYLAARTPRYVFGTFAGAVRGAIAVDFQVNVANFILEVEQWGVRDDS